MLLLEVSVRKISQVFPLPQTWEAADGMFFIYLREVELESDLNIYALKSTFFQFLNIAVSAE